MAKATYQVDRSLQKRIEKHDKLERVAGYLKELSDEGFTGYVKLNFSQGCIGRVEKFEEVLKN